jgi:hypothetical protein
MSSAALAPITWGNPIDLDEASPCPTLATVLPLSPFITDAENRFVLDEEKFMADIEPMPSFLSAPREEYLRAAEIIPLLAVLARHT